MTSTHPEAQVYIGARWEFHGKLYNSNGSVMDVTDKTIEWALLDKYQQPVLNSVGDVTINKLDAVNGLIAIIVSTAKTTMVSPGRYTDFLRINGEDIMWTGQIIANASPFRTLILVTDFTVGAPVLGVPTLSIV
jgi:hypothetical protein